ncbi:hypothetical protein HYT58_00115 [Candidatus Woesearchaeota archaeon]|nr:hypothetical protein [Candidatus Woesearchaeota archaeon]
MLTLDKIYPAVLAHDVTLDESRKFIPDYDAISRGCDKANRFCFVPYRYVGIGDDDVPNLDPREVYNLINEQAIPQSNLVLVFNVFPSTDVGMMMGRAQISGKLTIPIFRRGQRKQIFAIKANLPEAFIEYGDLMELEALVESTVREFCK